MQSLDGHHHFICVQMLTKKLNFAPNLTKKYGPGAEETLLFICCVFFATFWFPTCPKLGAKVLKNAGEKP